MRRPCDLNRPYGLSNSVRTVFLISTYSVEKCMELINDNLVDIIEVNDISEVTKFLSETDVNYSSIFIDEYFMIKFQNIEDFFGL